jgi:DNA-binding NarL/FixJ family response regulator
MAKIVLIGLEQTAAGQICRALDPDRHQVESQAQDAVLRDLANVDIVFAGGEPDYYMSLLRLIREERPSLPFVVVTRIAETEEWLNALEAGATDYCSAPIDTRQLHWLMESALSGPSPSVLSARELI